VVGTNKTFSLEISPIPSTKIQLKTQISFLFPKKSNSSFNVFSIHFCFIGKNLGKRGLDKKKCNLTPVNSFRKEKRECKKNWNEVFLLPINFPEQHWEKR
jgi:hypothetical protein